MSAFITCCTMLLSIAYGMNVDRVLRIYLPRYREDKLLGRLGIGIPLIIAGCMLMNLLAGGLEYILADARGSYMLALLAGVSVLLWLRDQYPEHDHD